MPFSKGGKPDFGGFRLRTATKVLSRPKHFAEDEEEEDEQHGYDDVRGMKDGKGFVGCVLGKKRRSKHGEKYRGKKKKKKEKENAIVIAALPNSWNVGTGKVSYAEFKEREKQKTVAEPMDVDGPLLQAKKEKEAPAKDGYEHVNKPKTLEEEAMEELMRGEGKKQSLHCHPLRVADSAKFEEERYKEDVEECAPDIDGNSKGYELVPVEAFGKAMLMGMGWSKGKPVGRTAKRVVEPVEFVKRPDRLGLGADPNVRVGCEVLEFMVHVQDFEPPGKEKKGRRKYIPRPGEKKGPKPYMVVAPDEEGKRRHWKTLDEALVKHRKEGLHVGCYAVISEGAHAGLLCRVKAIGLGAPRVLLVASNEETAVDKRALKWVDEADVQSGKVKEMLEDIQRKQKKLLKKARSKRPREHESHSGSRKRQNAWVVPHIRVRIVSKSFAKGRFYNKKAVVVDVPTEDVCIVRLDDGGEMVENVPMKKLDTALPKKGGMVRVVGGKHKGRFGTVLERRSRDQVAVVQFQSDLHISKLHYDDVCEWCGDPDVEDV